MLATLLRDPDKQVRLYTTLDLFKLGPTAKPLTPALLLNLADGDYLVRGSAATALGKIGSPDDRVVAAVLPLLSDPEWWVRRDAADALGDMGAVHARPALQQALADPDPRVRTAAREALDRLNRGRR
jgi:HEAT repeat protein